jgi:septal ring factor EnvC (AmiA/AmiB activator)
MSDYITEEVHKEFATRVDAENQMQNKRIDKLEETVKEIQRLTVAVERMAVSMEAMTKEIASQGQRLDAIEKEPADKWKNAVWIVVSALIAAAIGALMRGGI